MMSPTVPEGMSLALFKGTRPGIEGVYNRVGRYLDAGPYSHCELVLSSRISASSSFIDGGVRRKQINYSSVGSWDFLRIPDPLGIIEKRAIEWFDAHDGAKYDIMGNIRFGTNFARHSEDRWFCSEADGASVGIPEAFRHGPSGLAVIMRFVFGGELIVVNQ